jgi:hypothetical protein
MIPRTFTKIKFPITKPWRSSVGGNDEVNADMNLDYKGAYSRMGACEPSPTLIRRTQWFSLTLVLLLIIVTGILEFENKHFMGFFPRKPDGNYLVLFEKDAFASEGKWRDWQRVMHQNIELYRDGMSISDRKEMLSRLAENSRWNRFVDLVRLGAIVQLLLLLGVVASIFVINRMWAWRFGRLSWGRRTSVWFISATVFVILLEMIYRGYLTVFCGDIHS